MIDAAEISRFKSMGFTDQEISEAVNEVNQEGNTSVLRQSYDQASAMNRLNVNPSNTLIAGQMNQENLIKWQLELDSILERIEHILRGDKPTMVNGNMIFVTSQNDADKLFNDGGVAEIMRILSMYLNRNTILSNYDEATINDKMFDLGNELSDQIYLKYEVMGMNSLEKRKRYPMIVREIVDSVHSAYLRALHGGERDSLRQARNITQNETIMPGGMGFSMGGQPVMKERSLLNPLRYFKSKYA